jgi:asparagine synthase (glutamine-hydrolyzing)
VCGIAGIADSTRSASLEPLIQRMTVILRHRGPDADGFYVDDVCALGHRRLSIVDLATGQQPMCNEDGSLWISYNGEIFNHADLRADLEAAGHRYKSRSDTETILHAYEEYGSSCVTRFRGMFAFAIWDRKHRRLFCARDRLGIKPFYWWSDGRALVFASEIKALLTHPAIRAELEPSTLPEYLAFGYLSREQTMFRGIRKLMPGHTMEVQVDPDGVQWEVRQYWDVPKPEATEDRDESEWVAECRQRLEETVRMRLMSDVPLGVFLSGGVDSSAIAALMTRMVAGKVKTFSVGYREASYSELSYARTVAGVLQTDHHEVTVGMEEFFNSLPCLIWHEDEPITWPSSVSLYFVSRLASKTVKVVLTGEGSDELFAGYSRYRLYLENRRWMERYKVIPPVLRSWVRRRIATTPLLSAGLRRKLGHTFLVKSENLESLYLDNFYSAFSADEQRSLRKDTGSPYAGFLSWWESRSGASLLDRMLYADQKTYLVELLMKQDQMSMACSIESRVPLLDHPLVEFASRVPAGLKIRKGTGKYLFKRAVEDLLPREIVYRRKMGFPTPLRDWLASPSAAPLYELLRSRHGILADCVDPQALSGLLERHLSGFEDATDKIWRLLNLQIWGDVYLLGRGEDRFQAPEQSVPLIKPVRGGDVMTAPTI